MKASLKPYPQSKDSGLPWVRRIPAHWEVRRNGRLFAQRNEIGYGKLPILEVSLRTGVRVRDMDDQNRKQVMSDREKYKRAVKGDIAYNMMRMWQGAVGVVPEDGLVSPAYIVARPYPKVEPRYFSYLFRTDDYKNEVDGFSRGIVKDRNRLYWEDFKRMPSCFPPLEEQKAIADYLDAHAMKARRFIRNRRRLIEVLNEQKQAIINRAVTRGLDPNAPLKPSGIDWLGDVPAHWTVHKLKHTARFLNGIAFKPVDWRSAGVPIIRIQNLNGGPDFNYTDRRGLSQDLLIQPGELLFAWSGNRGTSFGSFMWERQFPAYLNQHIFKVTDYSLDRSYFYYVLRAVTAHVEEQAHGIIGLVHITKPELGAISIPVPPEDEQNQIGLHLDEVLCSMNQLADRARREIDLIREYRTRLISDVVTGKVDVREVAPAETQPKTELNALEDSEWVSDEPESDLIQDAADQVETAE